LTGSALILAGGQGTRIACDKKNLKFGSVNILSNLVDRLSSLFEEVLLSVNDGTEYRNAVTIKDEIGIGPLAGIYRGLSVCKSEYLYVTACDMPFLSGEYIKFLETIVSDEAVDACVARREDGFYEPFNALYNKSALPVITEAINSGRYGMNRILDQMKLYVVEYPVTCHYAGGNMFFNINYKEDLQRLEMYSCQSLKVEEFV
jgi:molybdopterin-guanine dinucleotide biosynthesis protein A